MRTVQPEKGRTDNYILDHQRHRGVANGRPANRHWLPLSLVGLSVGMVILVWSFSSNNNTPALQNNVRIVEVAPIQSGRILAYNYQPTAEGVPLPLNEGASLPQIDDTSSAEEYKQSCLASLTRDNNPEILALPESSREAMCTDPRRK